LSSSTEDKDGFNFQRELNGASLTTKLFSPDDTESCVTSRLQYTITRERRRRRRRCSDFFHSIRHPPLPAQFRDDDTKKRGKQ